MYPPAKPTDLTIKELDETTVTIAWTDNADNETGYAIARSVNGGDYSVIGTADKNATEFKENLPDDTIYSYKIYAFNSAGNSESTNEEFIKRPKFAKADITTASGGNITLNNLATITFPPNSFVTDVSITAIKGINEGSVAEEKQPYLDIVSDIKYISIIDFTAKDLVLKKNVNLVMNYDPAFLTKLNEDLQAKAVDLISSGSFSQDYLDKMKISESDLDIYYFNTITSKWIKTNAIIDTTLHTLTLNSPYLGIYCIGYSQAVKTGFSLEADPEAQQTIVNTIINPDQNMIDNERSKSTGLCNSTSSSTQYQRSPIPDSYKSDCNRCPKCWVFDDKGNCADPKIPGSGKNAQCDNCSSLGFITDLASGLLFTGACAKHDCCYRYGYATYGYNKEKCDYFFKSEMDYKCLMKFPTRISKVLKMFGMKKTISIHQIWNIPFFIYCSFLSTSTYIGVGVFLPILVATPLMDDPVVPYNNQICYNYGNRQYCSSIPIINYIISSPTKANIEPGETINFYTSINNPDYHPIFFTWSASHGTINNPSLPNIIWTSPSSIIDDISATITLSISDGINSIPPRSKTVKIMYPYTITYESNGATSGTAPSIPGHTYYGSLNYVSQNTGNLAKTGNYFAGWNTQADGNGIDYYPGNFFIMGKENAVFFAKWLPAYTVGYDGNGNTGGTAPVDSNYYRPGATVNVLNNTGNLVNGTDYFVGWNTQTDGTGNDRAPGGTFTMGALNITLFAKWSGYPVTYNGNGGTGTAPIDLNFYSIGDLVTVKNNSGSIVRAGHTFIGWNTSADGSGTDYAEEAVFPFAGGSITLFAKWLINTYTVTFDSMGGSPVTAQTVNYGTAAVQPAAPTKTGYNFVGWYKEPACVNQWNFSDFVTANITLYARWTIITFTMTFNSMGGSSVSAQTINYGAKAVTPAAPTRSGFNFGGWYKEPEYTNLWDFNSEIVTADVVIYARWTTYALRDTGPAGGLIFYDKGSYTDGWRYLEAAPNDQESMPWGEGIFNPDLGDCYSYIGVPLGLIGIGNYNTSLIVGYYGEGNYAAKVSNDLIINGYTDWFLPSIGELDKMYQQLKEYGVGGFATVVYWSSSEESPIKAQALNFLDGSGSPDYSFDKYRIFNVRCVRSF